MFASANVVSGKQFFSIIHGHNRHLAHRLIYRPLTLPLAYVSPVRFVIHLNSSSLAAVYERSALYPNVTESFSGNFQLGMVHLVTLFVGTGTAIVSIMCLHTSLGAYSLCAWLWSTNRPLCIHF